MTGTSTHRTGSEELRRSEVPGAGHTSSVGAGVTAALHAPHRHASTPAWRRLSHAPTLHMGCGVARKMQGSRSRCGTGSVRYCRGGPLSPVKPHQLVCSCGTQSLVLVRFRRCRRISQHGATVGGGARQHAKREYAGYLEVRLLYFSAALPDSVVVDSA